MSNNITGGLSPAAYGIHNSSALPNSSPQATTGTCRLPGSQYNVTQGTSSTNASRTNFPTSDFYKEVSILSSNGTSGNQSHLSESRITNNSSRVDGKAPLVAQQREGLETKLTGLYSQLQNSTSEDESLRLTLEISSILHTLESNVNQTNTPSLSASSFSPSSVDVGRRAQERDSPLPMAIQLTPQERKELKSELGALSLKLQTVASQDKELALKERIHTIQSTLKHNVNQNNSPSLSASSSSRSSVESNQKTQGEGAQGPNAHVQRAPLTSKERTELELERDGLEQKGVMLRRVTPDQNERLNYITRHAEILTRLNQK